MGPFKKVLETGAIERAPRITEEKKRILSDYRAKRDSPHISAGAIERALVMHMDKTIEAILKFRHIAVVGLSQDPEKDSHKVGLYLKLHGYHIVPINPAAGMVLDEESYSSLLEIPAETASTIQTILVFRPAPETLGILLQALKLQEAFGRIRAIWLQKGIKNEKTRKFAEKAQLLFVQDKCLMQEHKRLQKPLKKTKTKKH